MPMEFYSLPVAGINRVGMFSKITTLP